MTEPELERNVSELAPVGQYHLHPMNARVHDTETIKDGLREFGQIKPVVVSRRTGYVVAGNGTLKAIRELGWSTAWFLLVPDLSDADEARLLALDNKSHERGGYDDEKLLDLLNKINEDRQGLAGTGWTDREHEKLLKASQSAAERTAELFKASGLKVGESSTVRFTIPDPEAAQRFRAQLDELRQRWFLDLDGQVIMEALRRAVERSNS